MSRDTKQWWRRMGLTIGIVMVVLGTAVVTASFLKEPSIPGVFTTGNMLVVVGAMLIPGSLAGVMRQ